ncbi:MULTISPECIES: serine/threonine protein kinase [Photorhabdus]|uniref:Protein kinase n=1 Tax=Photorhabdus kayaii TaxID=230088 RepID=A0ABX0AWS6_9GAMM|nr:MULTISPECIES: serine/threonine-protein kinase [Photorhabdus]MCC8376698.1 serine/threonine protein kinase [Photorhabdus bodei]MCC8467042.1 serine/threonine protein kinase [Photorhabdus bodei]NDL14391.1 protein kinase [Photorhabdus kayaii]NDL23929.1 protein kinase [Photorhabdus kayaii]RAX12524.1 serine/threonine protein kinase [Photorhabdus sp. HUG-39]
MEIRGNYQIKPIKVLGGGNFGKVELVELYTLNGALSGLYARKILSVNENFVGEIYSYDDWKKRFQREVRYQASCCHSNVVHIYIHHLNIDTPWFIMDLAQNHLRSDLREDRLDLNEKIEVAKMVLKGVQHIHERGYLHRDLKPENILRHADGTYKVSDFGLVKNADSQAESEMISNMAVNMGTDGYMSFEAKKGMYSVKSDIYALGIIIHEIGISQVNGIDDIIRKSTCLKPADRYDSVSEMLIDLDKVIERSGR